MNKWYVKVKDATERFLGLSFNYAWKNSAWVSLDTAVDITTSFFTSIAFANLIPPPVYGSYRYILSVNGFFGFLHLKWINSVVSQEIARGRYGVFFWAINKKLRWGSLFLLVFLTLAVFSYIKGDYFIAGSFVVIAVMEFLTNVFNMYETLLDGNKLFKRKAFYSSFTTILQAPLIIGVLLVTPNLIFIILSIQLIPLLTSAYFYFQTIKRFSINKYQKESSIDMDTERLSRHLHPLNIFATIANNSDSLLLFNLFGPVVLASYAIAKNFPALINKCINNVSFIYFPKLAFLSLKQIRKIFYFRLMQTIVLGILVSVIYIIFIPFLFTIFYPQYPDAKFYTQLIGLSFILFVPNRYFAYIFQTQKLIKAIYVTSIIPLTVRFILYIILGYVMGILGVIIAGLISSLASFIISLIMWHKEIKNKYG